MNVGILFGRKNSKSIKNKNIFKIFSKPMFMYPLDAAKTRHYPVQSAPEIIDMDIDLDRAPIRANGNLFSS